MPQRERSMADQSVKKLRLEPNYSDSVLWVWCMKICVLLSGVSVTICTRFRVVIQMPGLHLETTSFARISVTSLKNNWALDSLMKIESRHACLILDYAPPATLHRIG